MSPCVNVGLHSERVLLAVVLYNCCERRLLLAAFLCLRLLWEYYAVKPAKLMNEFTLSYLLPGAVSCPDRANADRRT